MILRLLGFCCFSILIVSGCKKLEGNNTGCAAGTVGCDASVDEKTKPAILGRWKSRDFTETSSLRYFQRLTVSENQVRFSQVCSKRGGASVAATVYVDVKIDKVKITVLRGTEREEFSNGISCRIRVFPGEWQYQKSGNSLSLELVADDHRQTLHFVPES